MGRYMFKNNKNNNLYCRGGARGQKLPKNDVFGIAWNTQKGFSQKGNRKVFLFFYRVVRPWVEASFETINNRGPYVRGGARGQQKCF